MKDQLQRDVILKAPPKRIISLVPSQTELLVDLGLENYIVGVTKFCVHPIGFKNSKQIVGGTKNINLEIIRGLNPDIILCNKEENTKEIVGACEKIAPTHVSNIFTINDSKQLIKQYGILFSCEEKAALLNKSIDHKYLEFKTEVSSMSIKKAAYFIWRKPWMVVANNTFIHHVLEINNFKNNYANQERYPEIELNTLRESIDLDYILLSSEPFPFGEKHKQEILKEIPNVRVVLVDGEMFSWYGSRLLKAFDYFKKLHNSLN